MSWPTSETTTSTGVTASQAKQLSDGNPDGTVLGQSSTDNISFFGGTPTTRPASISVVSTQTWGTVPGACFGPTSSTLAAAFVTAVDDIRAALKLLGLTA